MALVCIFFQFVIHLTPGEHYTAARGMFHVDRSVDNLLRLQSISDYLASIVERTNFDCTYPW